MQYILATSLAWLSSNVQAHPGHDHGSLSSGLIHLSLGLAIPAVTAASALFFYNRRQNRTKQHESKS